MNQIKGHIRNTTTSESALQATLATDLDEGRLASQTQNGAWEILTEVPDTPAPRPIAAATPALRAEASKCDGIRAGLSRLAKRYGHFDCRSAQSLRRASL